MVTEVRRLWYYPETLWFFTVWLERRTINFVEMVRRPTVYIRHSLPAGLPQYLVVLVFRYFLIFLPSGR